MKCIVKNSEYQFHYLSLVFSRYLKQNLWTIKKLMQFFVKLAGEY